MSLLERRVTPEEAKRAAVVENARPFWERLENRIRTAWYAYDECPECKAGPDQACRDIEPPYTTLVVPHPARLTMPEWEMPLRFYASTREDAEDHLGDLDPGAWDPPAWCGEIRRVDESLEGLLDKTAMEFRATGAQEGRSFDWWLDLLQHQVDEARRHHAAGDEAAAYNEVCDVVAVAWEILDRGGHDPADAITDRVKTRILPRIAEIQAKDNALLDTRRPL